MNKNELIGKLERLIEEVKVGILATVDQNNKPHMRWMTPTFLKGDKDVLYAVTSPTFAKVIDLSANPNGQWRIQSKALDRIINIRGKLNILENPSLKAQILENIGNHLSVFWKMNEDPNRLVILETIIEEGVYFQPMKGQKTKVEF